MENITIINRGPSLPGENGEPVSAVDWFEVTANDDFRRVVITYTGSDKVERQKSYDTVRPSETFHVASTHRPVVVVHR